MASEEKEKIVKCRRFTSPPASLRPHPRPLSRGEGIVEVRELVGKSNFFLFSSLFKLHFYPEYPRIRISTFFSGVPAVGGVTTLIACFVVVSCKYRCKKAGEKCNFNY